MFKEKQNIVNLVPVKDVDLTALALNSSIYQHSECTTGSKNASFHHTTLPGCLHYNLEGKPEGCEGSSVSMAQSVLGLSDKTAGGGFIMQTLVQEKLE